MSIHPIVTALDRVPQNSGGTRRRRPSLGAASDVSTTRDRRRTAGRFGGAIIPPRHREKSENARPMRATWKSPFRARVLWRCQLAFLCGDVLPAHMMAEAGFDLRVIRVGEMLMLGHDDFSRGCPAPRRRAHDRTVGRRRLGRLTTPARLRRGRTYFVNRHHVREASLTGGTEGGIFYCRPIMG